MIRVTLEQVAREAGVGKATASRALADVGSVSADTKARVRAAAERLGYQRDPALAAIAAHRWGMRRSETGTVIAHLRFQGDGYEEPDDKAVALAAQEGYQVQSFLVEEKAHGSQLARMLRARGIRGLFIRNTEWTRPIEGFPWEEFVVASYGPSYYQPPGAFIGIRRFAEMEMAIEHALTFSGARVGWVAFWGSKGRAPENAESIAAFEYFSRRHRGRICRRILELHGGQARDDQIQALAEWMKKQGPEVVIGYHIGIYYYLLQLGYRIPEEIAFINQHAGEVERGRIAGVAHGGQIGGEVAMEVLLRELLFYRLGHIRRDVFLALNPVWMPGASFPEPGEKVQM